MKTLPGMVLARLERDLQSDDDNACPVRRMILDDYLERNAARLEAGRQQLARAEQTLRLVGQGVDQKEAILQVAITNYVDESTVRRSYEEYITNTKYWAVVSAT